MEEVVKAISLWEPYASLIRTGAKTVETRSRSTSYRGPLLICAAKDGLYKTELYDLLNKPVFQQGLMPGLGHSVRYNLILDSLHFGQAVALVELVDCIPTREIGLREIEKDAPFGDFTSGRFAWKLRMINNTFAPFPVKGKQWLFDAELPEGIIL